MVHVVTLIRLSSQYCPHIAELHLCSLSSQACHLRRRLDFNPNPVDLLQTDFGPSARNREKWLKMDFALTGKMREKWVKNGPTSQF